MEPIFFYFKKTPIDVNKRFTLDFSNTELIYQVNFSTENDYYTTTMNCNLVIANDFDGRFKDIKDLSEKSRLLLKNGPAYQLDLFYFALGFYCQGMKRNWTDLYFFSFQKNINCYSWKYKFYDFKDNLIKDCKIFSPYTQFLNKGLSF